MIAMSEYYLVINKSEIGPAGQILIERQRQCGCVEPIGSDAYRIRNFSEKDQQTWFAAFEAAIDKDFPPPCGECGCEKTECSCDPEPDPEAEDAAYWSGDRIYNCKSCNTPLHLPGLCRDCRPNAEDQRPGEVRHG